VRRSRVGWKCGHESKQRRPVVPVVTWRRSSSRDIDWCGLWAVGILLCTFDYCATMLYHMGLAIETLRALPLQPSPLQSTQHVGWFVQN